MVRGFVDLMLHANSLEEVLGIVVHFIISVETSSKSPGSLLVHVHLPSDLIVFICCSGSYVPYFYSMTFQKHYGISRGV